MTDDTTTQAEGTTDNQAKPERVTIELTKRQADIADWLMGTPTIAEWHSHDEVKPGFKRRHMEKPELDGREFTFPADDELVYYMADPKYGDLERVATESGGHMEGQKQAGFKRAARNLAKKIRKAAGYNGR
jgi:hypothetical protein